MPAGTLKKMAIEAASRNLSGIVDVADITYDLIQPLLVRIRNADQLLEIEKNSPHIAESDEELWRAFIRREIPDWRNKIVEPKNPRSWGKVYKKLKRNDDKAKAEQERKLHEALQGTLQTKAANATQYIDRVIPTKCKQSSWSITPKAPQSLKNAKKGKDILAALRKKTADEMREKGRTAPTFKVFVPNSKSQIKEAPKSMVIDAQHAQQARQPGLSNISRSDQSVPVVNRYLHDSVPKVSNVFAKNNKAPSRQQRMIDQAIREEQVKKDALERSAKTATGGKGARSPPPPPAHHTPQPATQPVKRKGAASIFMPHKKRKI